MNAPQAWHRRYRLLRYTVGLLMLDGCSLLYDFGTHQCNTTSDCLRMGPQFANSVCKNEICVAVAAQSGAATAGTTNPPTAGSAAGGPEAGGVAGVAAATSFAGAMTSAGTPMSSGAAGVAGASSTPACSNEQCMAAHGSPTFICRNNACVELTTTDCPVLIPMSSAARLLKQQDVIVVGGFATMANKGNPHDSQAIVNWDLAFDEFNTATFDGLPAYPGGGQRPLVGLICNGSGLTPEAVNATMKHLTSTVQVPAILSTLPANNLYQAWQYLDPTNPSSDGKSKSVFVMSTGSADLRLANLSDDGLIWHMLGDPRTLAAPIVALLKQLEPVVNAERAANFQLTGVDDPATNPLRVTLISSDEPIMVDIADVLTSTADANHPGTMLTFNGLSVADNYAAGSLRWKKIESARQHDSPNVTAGLKDLSDYPPHVIVAMATKEFPSLVLSNVENTWGSTAAGHIRPYYLMSHLIYNTPELEAMAKNFSSLSPPLEKRVVGINYASSQASRAKQLYGEYLVRLKSTYQGTLSLDGTENHYDGAYYLLYSIAAAAASLSKPLGSDIAFGLKTRIISDSDGAISVDVGYGPLSGSGTGSGTISRLFGDKVGYRISLYGTMGPPDFDRFSGTRTSATSAWCLQQKAGSTWEWRADGLLYDLPTRAFSPSPDGIPTCLQRYCQTLSSGTTPTCLLPTQ